MPEPGGRRDIPPPRVRTALGTNQPQDQAIVLHLLSEDEARALATAFNAKNQRVVSAGHILDLLELAAISEPNPLFVLTDDPTLPRRLTDYWEDAKPCVVVLVDGRESAIDGAWNAGADWVVARPLDFDNPLGLREE